MRKLLSSMALFAHVASAATILSVQPSTTNTTLGSQATLNINISGVIDLYAYQFDLKFAPGILSAASVANGLFLSSLADGTFLPGTIDNVGGTISATADTKTGPVSGVSGSGTLAVFKFMAIGNGSSQISIPTLSVILLDSNLNDIPFTTADGTVNVGGVANTPEPNSLALVLIGTVGIVGFRRFAVRRAARVG